MLHYGCQEYTTTASFSNDLKRIPYEMFPSALPCGFILPDSANTIPIWISLYYGYQNTNRVKSFFRVFQHAFKGHRSDQDNHRITVLSQNGPKTLDCIYSKL